MHIRKHVSFLENQCSPIALPEPFCGLCGLTAWLVSWVVGRVVVGIRKLQLLHDWWEGISRPTGVDAVGQEYHRF